jgi:hemerythrin-like domain-containing protein
MLNIMFYITNLPDVLHHPKEDLAFARIKERAVNAGPIVDELTAQHARLKEGGNALVHALDDIVNGSITSREHIEGSGRAYVADFRSRMVREETAILPLAARLLRNGDWAAIDAAIWQSDDTCSARTGRDVMPRSVGRSRAKSNPRRRARA